MKLFLIIGLLIFTSCNVSKQIINTKDMLISLNKMQCGSYEVKNYESPIGYAVKPFIIEVENRSAEITKFENLVKSSYNNRYRNFFRIYLFTINSTGDTILNVIMLKPKLAYSISNWQCEEQDVDTYFRSKKYPHSGKVITYNSSKGRFKILGDPD
ncbi:MAG: hypothetical protein ACM3VS_10065 [Candidatus Dadabacteria bacterium]